jgi:hypothetical protein
VTKRPLVAKAQDPRIAELNAAIESDGLLREALEHAQAAEDEESQLLHLWFADARLSQLVAWPDDYRRAALVARATGRLLRVAEIPGIAGRVVWAIRDEADAAALRAEVGPGQVWVRADLATDKTWPTIRAHAMDARERTLGIESTSGRPEGSTNRARDELIAAIRADDGMTDAAIEDRAIAAGIWEPIPDGHATAPEVRRVRLARIRRAARSRNP